jgi:hypothetical protein
LEEIDKHSRHVLALRNRLKVALDEYLVHAPETYTGFSEAAALYRDTALDVLAGIATTHLNRHIQKLPQDTPEKQKEISDETNTFLRRLDLSIRCPNTGKPTLLDTAPRYGQPRFALKTGNLRTKYWQTLPEIELMPAPPRRANFVEHTAEQQHKPRGR